MRDGGTTYLPSATEPQGNFKKEPLCGRLRVDGLTYLPEEVLVCEPHQLQFSRPSRKHGVLAKECDNQVNRKVTATRSYTQDYYYSNEKVTIIGDLVRTQFGFELHPPQDGKSYMIIRTDLHEPIPLIC